MRGYREGSANGTRWRGALGRVLLVVGLLGGCANGSGNPETRVAAKAEPAKPEQVVQRIEPGAEPALNSAPQSPAAPTAAGQRAPARGTSISSKHLEAELNRLEAELK